VACLLVSNLGACGVDMAAMIICTALCRNASIHDFRLVMHDSNQRGEVNLLLNLYERARLFGDETSLMTYMEIFLHIYPKFVVYADKEFDDFVEKLIAHKESIATKDQQLPHKIEFRQLPRPEECA